MHKFFASIVGIVVFILTVSFLGISFGYIFGHNVSIGNLTLRIIALFIALIVSSIVYNRLADNEVEEKPVSKRVQTPAKSTKNKDISEKLEEMRKSKEGTKRGYLICESCGGYYELQPGETADDFRECECGGTLKYHNSLPDTV